jgi:hypothetical protein
MIRALYIIITTLALAHFLGGAVFLAWLSATDRLSIDRLADVREMFAETVAHERAREDLEAQAAADQAELDAQLAKQGTPPITAEQRVERDLAQDRATEQRLERMRRDTQDRFEALMRRARELEAERAAFEREREAFNRLREEIARREGDEQFEKAVRMYEGLQAEQAGRLLENLVNEDETAQVVAYLNAMKARSATAIVASIAERDAALATDLLERLREHGLVADVAPEEP